jgi:hypothetical protein
MGVKKESFIQLQNQARLDISMSLLQHTSKQYDQYDGWESLHSVGTQYIKDQFLRSLLLLHTRER